MKPLLVRIENLKTRAVDEYGYLASPVRIGRNALNDLVLDQPFVSQWHAIVHFDDSRTAYFDMGSTNGTLVDGGKRAEKNVEVRLEGEKSVTIGTLRLTFVRGSLPASARVGRPDHAALAFQATGHANEPPAPRTQLIRPEDLAAAMQGTSTPGTVPFADVLERVRPHHAAYQKAAEDMAAVIRQTMASLPPAARPAFFAALVREFPTITDEARVRTVAESARVPIAAVNAVGRAGADLVGRIATFFVPAQKAPETPEDMAAFATRLVAVLDAFGSSFVALRRGYDQFGADMALPGRTTAGHGNPLRESDQPRDVMAYLLEWRKVGPERVQELTSSFADMMTHQVALLNGLMEGVRSLLQRLGPAEVEKDLQRKPGSLGGTVFWPFPAAQRWLRYTQLHRDLTEEDSGISAAVFGSDFARAYSGVMGEKVADAAPRQLNPPR